MLFRPTKNIVLGHNLKTLQCCDGCRGNGAPGSNHLLPIAVGPSLVLHAPISSNQYSNGGSRTYASFPNPPLQNSPFTPPPLQNPPWTTPLGQYPPWTKKPSYKKKYPPWTKKTRTKTPLDNPPPLPKPPQTLPPACGRWVSVRVNKVGF